jgi:hypothetical protein
MANQIVVSAGAKVRNLDGVLTATSGVVSSVPLGAANGVATLDSGGKVPVSQLPSSVVTYLGTWNAATNTPTLVNGTGDAGDMYICNVAGTVNFGAGPVTFAVGDWVLYGSGTWQKSNGQNGTVTSVAASITGSAIGITGSPITTAGTLAFAFSGTSGQYINGAGNLVTFPTIITESQRLVTEVYNETGATLTKGTVVYINGGHGNLPTVTKAIATGDATSAQTYGIVQTDITNMNNGYVVVIGSLMDLDTQAYPNGTQLYLSSTVAGAWTSVKQYAPAHLVYVAIVTRSHPTQGVVEVRIQNGFELDELHNVSAQTPSNNDGIFYNSTTSLWESKSIATALGYTPANDASVVHLAGTETITGEKTFTNVNGTQFDYGIVSPLTSRFDQGIIFKKGTVPTIFTTITTNLYSESTSNNLVIQDSSSKAKLLFNNSTQTYTFPAATGTIALTSDISYPVTSVFGRTGAVVATSGDYTTTQVTEGTNLYYTDVRARASLSFVAGSGAYNSTTGVITIPTDNSQIANGAGYITSSALSGYLPLTGGTLTGALNINVSSGTAMNVAGNAIFRGDTGVGTPRQLIITSGGSTPVYLEAKGYGANYQTDFGIRTFNSVGTSFEVFYANANGNVGINQVNPSYQLDVNGTGRFSNSLTVDYAAGDVDLNVKNTQSAGAANLYLRANANGAGDVRFARNSDGSIQGRISYSFTDGSMNFRTGGNDNRLLIASTGAATFSSSVTAQLLAISNGYYLVGRNAANTAFRTLVTFDSSNKIIIGQDSDITAVTLGVGSEAMRITSGGNLEMSSASDINFGGSGKGVFLSRSGLGPRAALTTRTNITYVDIANSADWSGATICASGGNVLIGTTNDSGYKFQVEGQIYNQGNSATSFILARNYSSGSITIQQFIQNGVGTIGSITFNGTAVLYNATSDYRLKQDFKDYNALSIISSIKTYDFEWKSNKTRSYGVIAHELAEIMPSIVSGDKDALDENGKVLPQAVDYSKIVPILIKSIQEQQLQIEELKLKIK